VCLAEIATWCFTKTPILKTEAKTKTMKSKTKAKDKTKAVIICLEAASKRGSVP